MSVYKNEVIIIGPSSINQNTVSCQIFSSTSAITTWVIGGTYAIGNCVEYSSAIYRSLISSNTGNQPDISPSDWEQVINPTKDGDIALIINGPNSDVSQRSNGVWDSMSQLPVSVALVDGQVSPAPALQYTGAVLPYAVISYTLRRGGGTGTAQEGMIIIQNDGSSLATYRHQFSHFGNTVGVAFSVAASAGTVSLNYTSTLQGSPLNMKFTLRGWS